VASRQTRSPGTKQPIEGSRRGQRAACGSKGATGASLDTLSSSSQRKWLVVKTEEAPGQEPKRAETRKMERRAGRKDIRSDE